MKKIFIDELKPKDSVDSLFMVKFIALVEARDGRNYLNVILSDAKGEIEARKWQGAQAAIDEVSRGSIVEVKGKVNQYQGRRQLIIDSIKLHNQEDVDLSMFTPQADQPAQDMYERLLGVVSEIKDRCIKSLMESILLDPEVARRLQSWQAGKSIHHAYKAGLLEHILNCTEIGLQLSKCYNVNSDYVVSGIILHDLGKIYELTDGLLVDYTEEGKLLGHVVKGVELIDKYAEKIDGFPLQMKNHLKHIMISHHGEYEYGSPKLPQTSEALLVHHIDLMDSKMHSFETVKKNDANDGSWTGYVKHLERMIFKDPLPLSTDKKELKKMKNSSGDLTQSLAGKLKNFKVGE